jgi:hypothetical protein
LQKYELKIQNDDWIFFFSSKLVPFFFNKQNILKETCSKLARSKRDECNTIEAGTRKLKYKLSNSHHQNKRNEHNYSLKQTEATRV